MAHRKPWNCLADLPCLTQKNYLPSLKSWSQTQEYLIIFLFNVQKAKADKMEQDTFLLRVSLNQKERKEASFLKKYVQTSILRPAWEPCPQG